MVEGWKYYNHAAVPSVAPHEEVDITPIENSTIWQSEERPLLARWTTDWDCGYKTNWWYIIKDVPFDINELKSKRRYEINKGKKNFIVKEILPIDWCKEICEVSLAAYRNYPESYRPHIIQEEFISKVKSWNFYKIYGAFSIKDMTLCGYACLLREGRYIDFCMMKAVPEKEKFGLNAAMVYKILIDHEDFLKSNGYICDGARSIQHETAFQDYLEKYFGFRKAYCKLHITYAPQYRSLVTIAFRFRKFLNKLNKFSFYSKINSVLKMEEINRESL